eukprot:2967024-Pleurochrysis_carterae.AAC.1
MSAELKPPRTTSSADSPNDGSSSRSRSRWKPSRSKSLPPSRRGASSSPQPRKSTAVRPEGKQPKQQSAQLPEVSQQANTPSSTKRQRQKQPPHAQALPRQHGADKARALKSATGRVRQEHSSSAGKTRVQGHAPQQIGPAKELEEYVLDNRLDCQSIANQACQADTACRQRLHPAAPYDHICANINTSAVAPPGLRHSILTSNRTLQRSRISRSHPLWTCHFMRGKRGTTCRRETLLHSLTTSCSLAADLSALQRLSVRSMLRLPVDGAKSCAVVGSSSTLLYERFGDEIDAHDVVIR